jgi:hypothetical protein
MRLATPETVGSISSSWAVATEGSSALEASLLRGRSERDDAMYAPRPGRLASKRCAWSLDLDSEGSAVPLRHLGPWHCNTRCNSPGCGAGGALERFSSISAPCG